MATVELDLPHLSSYLTFSETSLSTLLASPTIALVKDLLGKITTKSYEHKKVQAEKLKLDVELENVARAAESKARVLKATVEKGLKEVANLRQNLQYEETSRQRLESELQALKSSSTSSTSDNSVLKARIESLESSNRDTLAVLESKSTAYNDLSAELSAKHQKTIELRQEISTLETTIRSANAASSTAKFREQSLQSEIDSLKRGNEWLEQELKTKSAEYTKFRKDKNTRIAELQRQIEDATTTLDTLQRSETALKQRLDEVNSKSDDFLSQIQQLQENATRAEESFRLELDTSNRLAELMRKSLDTERERQQDLSAQLERAKDDASAEIGRINAEIETEHEDKLAAERRIAELEIQIERLEADHRMPEDTNTQPGTPAQRVNGHSIGTPVRGDSPSRTFSPNMSRVRGGLSMTQMITDYHNAKAEVEAEKRRNEKLSTTIDEMIKEMESRQPEVAELQADHDRLEADVLEMSSLVENIGTERDQARKDARSWEGQVIGLTRESDVLRQQLRDLGSQVKVLLMEIHSKNQGLESFTPEERMRLEQLARGDFDNEMSGDVTATELFIRQQLTTFRDIAEMQEQNTKLLRITHELGDKLEGEEAQREKTQASDNQEELQSLRQKYERCRDEIKSLMMQSQSYIRERDMFRRMLAHRGQIPQGSDMASMFGESINGGISPATPSRNNHINSVENSPLSKDMADYAKLLKDLQSHFDNYRQETSSDRRVLKEQVDGLSKQNSELKGEVSRKNIEVTLSHERYEMLQANYSMLKGENAELQKRSQILSDRAAKQDIRTQQVTEDLVEAKGVLESLRNEVANLKAEKDFWKNIEKRLTDDNQNLLSDRDRLNTLNANMQNLINEREQSDRDSRRKMQAQLESMESELQATRRKLSDEIEDGKRAALRREVDNKQSQSRIDDLVSSLGLSRDELRETKTARDLLQARVDEISVDLRSAEERLTVLQQSSVNLDSDAQSGSLGSTALGREQELAVQVSELKRDLELAQRDLANSIAQVDQYKAISQSAEEELQSINETQDQYRQEMDNIIQEGEAKIQELEQEIKNSRAQIQNLHDELDSLRTERVESVQQAEEQKAALEAEITKLKDTNERNESAAHYYQQDMKDQAEIARQAQQNYENELVKHAEAAKVVQTLRADYNRVRLEIVELKTEAESAKKTLSQSEESWAEAKDRYERELTELQARRNDVNAQNKLLHQQLETVSSQIASLQQKRASDMDNLEGTTEYVTSGNDNMLELVSYLRREKEIVDIQWELSSQETKRLRQQLEHTQSQLDEARLKLNQQRRAEENSERSAMNHQKLMETINELNLNRESNVALRLEKNQAQALLAEKLTIIEDLRVQIEPLQARIRELEDTMEAQGEDLRMTREARERFEQRYQDILHRTDAIDPAEVESLKEQVTMLQTERDDLLASKQTLQEQVNGIPDQIKQSQDQVNERFQESRHKLIEQSKAKAREQNTRIREKDAALQGAAQEKENLAQRLQAIEHELEAARSARDEAVAAQKAAVLEVPKVNQMAGSEDGQVDETETPIVNASEMQVLQEQLREATSKAELEAAKATQLQSDVNAAQLKVTELQSQITDLQQRLEQSNAEVSRLEAQQEQQAKLATSITDSNSSGDQIEKLRQDLAVAQSEAEALRTTASISESASRMATGEGSPSFAEQLTTQVDQIRAELTARHDERVRQAEETFQKRADLMKTQLSKRLADGKALIRQQVTEELNIQHQQELSALAVRHREELDQLRKKETDLIEQLKSADGTKNDTDVSAMKGEVNPPAMPQDWEPTEVEIHRLIQQNATVKTIMKNNIKQHAAKETARLQEEQTKAMNEKLADAEQKATQAREQAVVMEGKKYNVKISMAENRARSAQAKIDYIQKAAGETPKKPVAEVWVVAKDVKPTPILPQQVVLSSTGAQATPATNTATNTFAKAPPTGPSQKGLTGVNSRQPATSQATPSASNFQPVTQSATASPLSASLAPRSSNEATKSADPTANAMESTSEETPKSNGVQSETANQPTSTLLDNSLQAAPSQQINTGTGPAALKALQHSGLPVPSGGRGGAVPSQNQQQRGGTAVGRGRGRGAGRGGIPQVNTNTSNISPQSQGSPRGGPLSANAKQFVPQANKRPRDEGLEASQHANGAKRARGGHQGS
ncbi:hypothetical protein MMC26_003756 [Xylographa opegraphella]|nr:hypothetical protein [Xylographa opegraphella]